MSGRSTSGATSVFAEPQEVARRVHELGLRIASDHAGRDPVLVAVLKGSSVFLADLIRAVGEPLSVDFMAVSRFGEDGASGGRVKILKDLDSDIRDRSVILVEDIVDTGLTVAYLRSVLAARSPSVLDVCTLLDRSVRRIVPTDIRYAAFDCPDAFIVGYGLDLDGRHRNLPGLVAVHDLGAVAADPALLDAYLSRARPSGRRGTGAGEVAGLGPPA